MKAVGAYFKGARRAQGLKPEQVALRMAELMGENVSPATIYKIEGARMNPGLDLVLALLRVLNCDPRAMIAVARDEGMSAARGEEIGRRSIGPDDLAWLDALTDSERERARRYFEQND